MFRSFVAVFVVFCLATNSERIVAQENPPAERTGKVQADQAPVDQALVDQASSEAKDADADAKEEAVKQEFPPEPKATKVPKNDPDYDLLGEFVGLIKVDDAEQMAGLQVRPLGDGKFEALMFKGGVPGSGAEQDSALSLIGARFGKSIVLSGAANAVFLSSEKATVVSPEGDQLGELKRVERVSPTMGAKPPEGATVLFDGTSMDNFTSGSMTAEGLLKAGADVKPMFQDFNLHVEFRLPYMPNALDQARGNSGCYLQSRYEVQVLDSFATMPVFNGCSSLYRFKPADVNMCLPPLRWQTYDIAFTAARWASDGSKLRNARITVWHNGVKTQDDVELPNKTGAGAKEEPTLLPIKFQNHKDPVRFRNIWIVDRGLAPMAAFPALP